MTKSDWKEHHANEASKSTKHELVEGVIEEFMNNIGLADKGLPAYGIRKVAHYAAMVARAHALGFDPNLLRMSGEEATSHQLDLAARAVLAGVPVQMLDVPRTASHSALCGLQRRWNGGRCTCGADQPARSEGEDQHG